MMSYDPNERPSKQERLLDINAQLRHNQGIVFVVQVALSPGSPDHPQWATVYWWALGPEIERQFKSLALHISGDSSTVFADMTTAKLCADAINRQRNRRARVIVRHTSICEELVS